MRRAHPRARWLEVMHGDQRRRAFRIDTTVGMVLLWTGPVLIFVVAFLRMA